MKIIKKIWLFLKRLAIKAWNSVKQLGWFWGVISIIISLIIFYSPTIVSYILFVITDKIAYFIFSSAYITYWILPGISPGLAVYFAILIFVTTMLKKIVIKKASD